MILQILFKRFVETFFADEKINSDMRILRKQYDNAYEDIKLRFDDKVMKIQQGDDLLPR